MLSLRSNILLLGILILLAGVGPRVFAESSFPWPLPKECKQALVVTSPGWNAPIGTLQRFERQGSVITWTKIGQSIPVNLGRNGLGWGTSSIMTTPPITQEKIPTKREGDGRAPAGVFPILGAFGFPHAPRGYGAHNLRFQTITDEVCVDDPLSSLYNTITSPVNKVTNPWQSSETMRIDLYRMGLVIGHNCPQATSPLGSCIFFHIERGPQIPTAGCTSMPAKDLNTLLLWLKKDARATVLQFPRLTYQYQRHSSWPVIEPPPIRKK